MRVPRPRFTVRRMMIVVAVIAFGIAGFTLYGRRQRYLNLAATFAASERDMRVRAEDFEVGIAKNRHWYAQWRDRGGTEEELARHVGSQMYDMEPDYSVLMTMYRNFANATRAHEADCTRLKAKYERAARYPWLPVAPDPPEPE